MTQPMPAAMSERDRITSQIRTRAAVCADRAESSRKHRDPIGEFRWLERRHALLELALEIETTHWGPR